MKLSENVPTLVDRFFEIGKLPAREQYDKRRGWNRAVTEHIKKQSTLADVYDYAFECFCTGNYGHGDESKRHRHLSEGEAHEAALDFILWLYCEQRGLSYHKVFKKILLPRNFPELENLQPWIGWIKHTEVINFVSYETKLTRNKVAK